MMQKSASAAQLPAAVSVAPPETVSERREATGSETVAPHLPPKTRSRRFGPLLLVRYATVALAAAGLCTWAISAYTEIPLSTWLRTTDFKNAYTLENLTVSRGELAIRMGDLSGALRTAKSLPATSDAQTRLLNQIVTAALERKSLSVAAQAYATLNVSVVESERSTSLSLLSEKLIQTYGFQESIRFARTDPGGKLLGDNLVVALCYSGTVNKSQEVATFVEKSSLLLKKTMAQTLIFNFRFVERFEKAIQWEPFLPEDSVEYEHLLTVQSAASSHHPHAKEWIAGLPHLKDRIRLLADLKRPILPRQTGGAAANSGGGSL